MTEKHRSI